MNIPKNRTEEVWREIDENIKKLTEVLEDIDPEIRYDRTTNVLHISERALVKGRTNLIYASIKDPDMLNVFLTRECRDPKIIRNRFNLIKNLMELGYNSHISNASGPNIINAYAVNHVTYKRFYSSQYNYVTLRGLSNGNFDLEIHIANGISGISDHKETRKVNKIPFNINTRVSTPSDDETIAIEESYECKLTDIPVSEIRDEIVKVKETVEKHSKLVAIREIIA